MAKLFMIGGFLIGLSLSWLKMTLRFIFLRERSIKHWWWTSRIYSKLAKRTSVALWKTPDLNPRKMGEISSRLFQQLASEYGARDAGNSAEF